MPEQVSIPRKDILGAVLCGGKSKRFGSPKAFYRVEGVPLVERALRVLRPLVDEVVLAVGDSKEARWPNVPLVADRIPGVGPIGGMHAVLSEPGRDWVLVLPVDIPFMKSEALSLVIREARGGNRAVVAVDGNRRLHPLCGLYHTSMLQAIETAIAQEEYSMKRLLAATNSVRYVTLPDEWLRNVNRPEDLL